MKSPWAEDGVTFQVGMVGSDGVVLGSDRLNIQLLGTRSAFLADKIVIAEEWAYCCAGDDLSVLAAQRCIERIKENAGLKMRDHLMHSAQMAIIEESRTREARQGRQLYGGTVLLAVRESGNVDLWRLNVGTPTYADRVDNKICEGDPYNTARFFGERYFPKDKRPIADLLPLAAHAILMAGVTNSTGVKGLELAICTPSEIRKVAENEIARLVSLSGKLDAEIATALGLHQ
jgi:hypothetical protein